MDVSNYQLMGSPANVLSDVEYIKGIGSDGTQFVFPIDPKNTEYQKYLMWVAEGNTALPAEPSSTENTEN